MQTGSKHQCYKFRQIWHLWQQLLHLGYTGMILVIFLVNWHGIFLHFVRLSQTVTLCKLCGTRTCQLVDIFLMCLRPRKGLHWRMYVTIACIGNKNLWLTWLSKCRCQEEYGPRALRAFTCVAANNCLCRSARVAACRSWMTWACKRYIEFTFVMPDVSIGQHCLWPWPRLW